ncbi:MAG: NlpC/P60 family protein [Collinsella sp.]|nr:NlpC/P60 family protein [Collinsella sp.]
MAHLKRSYIAIPTATLAIILGLSGTPLYAHAATSTELQQELDEVSRQLNDLYAEAEQAGYDLHAVQSDLDKTNESIAQTEAEIEEEQAQLAELQTELGILATDQYKGGSFNLLSLLMNADSFDTLVSSMRYADKTATYQQGVISESKALQESLAEKKASLESDKEKQEKLVEEQQVKADAANAAAASAQRYYDDLSDEMKAKIQEEQAAERERARQEAEKAKEEAEQGNTSGGGNSGGGGNTSGGGNSGGGSTSGGGGTSGGGTSGGGSGSGGGNSGGGSGSGGGSHGTSSSAQAMVNRAWGIIGSGYSYSGYRWTGDPNTSWFTCSGVVDYALNLPTNSNSPESLYAAVGSRLTTNVNELAYGDLVFFRYGGRAPGHVGIYIGGGKMIDSCPGGGVQVRTLSFIGGFIGGGPIV